MVVLIPRQAGQRDDRYAHLLCGEVEVPPPGKTTASSAPAQTQTSSELDDLRNEVETLKQQLNALYQLTGHQVPD